MGFDWLRAIDTRSCISSSLLKPAAMCTSMYYNISSLLINYRMRRSIEIQFAVIPRQRLFPSYFLASLECEINVSIWAIFVSILRCIRFRAIPMRSLHFIELCSTKNNRVDFYSFEINQMLELQNSNDMCKVTFLIKIPFLNC